MGLRRCRLGPPFCTTPCKWKALLFLAALRIPATLAKMMGYINLINRIIKHRHCLTATNYSYIKQKQTCTVMVEIKFIIMKLKENSIYYCDCKILLCLHHGLRMCSLMTASIVEQVKHIMPCNHLSYMCANISRNTGDVLIIQTNELYTLKCVSPFKTCM